MPGDESEVEMVPPGAELTIPMRENGAETEVEGESRRMAVPVVLADAPVVEENDSPDPMVLVDASELVGEPGGSGHPIGDAVVVGGAGMEEMGGVVTMEDVDGTVGGKRKR